MFDSAGRNRVANKYGFHHFGLGRKSLPPESVRILPTTDILLEGDCEAGPCFSNARAGRSQREQPDTLRAQVCETTESHRRRIDRTLSPNPNVISNRFGLRGIGRSPNLTIPLHGGFGSGSSSSALVLETPVPGWTNRRILREPKLVERSPSRDTSRFISWKNY